MRAALSRIDNARTFENRPAYLPACYRLGSRIGCNGPVAGAGSDAGLGWTAARGPRLKAGPSVGESVILVELGPLGRRFVYLILAHSKLLFQRISMYSSALFLAERYILLRRLLYGLL